MANRYSTLEENDINSMYHAVWQFKEAAYRCGKTYPITIANVSKVLFIPQIVCLAFAIELEMKMISLLYKGRYISNNHDLIVLFNDLPEETIKQNCSSDIYNYLVENVSLHKEAFSDTRYYFQNNHSMHLDSKNFFEALEDVLFKIVEFGYKHQK